MGHFLIVLGFISALFSSFSYYRQTKVSLTKSQDTSWRTLGRLGFSIHGISIISLIALLFYIMISKKYEYSYVFDHVSDDLPMRYIFSAFWEGQEGSFLLWCFWHIILGFVLIKTAKAWESGVLMIVALVEAVLVSMLLGIHIEIGDFIYKLGSNPSMLVRDIFLDAPIFQRADYLTMLKGDGLNPLLQNYWMTIHPPTLFLGFASTTIPFAFAAAGLLRQGDRTWIKPALKWSLFSAGILGVGILMGGAWAYEALTFGGYWAWDPVENMSFVPWLVLIAGVHANLIANSTGRAIKSTYIYYTLSFVLILYSTYLTRSGILGETSAHAFTEMGLEPQLIFLVLFFAFLGMGIYIAKSKYVPIFEKEESSYSREFWMFVGALVLLFSGLIIAASTSLPVLNSIIRIWDPGFLGTTIKDPIPHYNKYQIWTSILVTVLTAKSVFLRYKSGPWSTKQKTNFATKQIMYFAVAGLLTVALSLWIDYFEWRYVLLTLCCLYAIVANAVYLLKNFKANPGVLGSVFGHVGFGIMIIGTIASGLNESVITASPFLMEGIVMPSRVNESVKLIEDEPLYVNDYWITYEGDTTISNSRKFTVKFQKENKNKVKEAAFYLYPNVLYTNDFKKIAATNPDTKHYLEKDIFIQIDALPQAQQDVELAKQQEDSLIYVKHTLGVGDTLFTKDKYAVLEYINFNPQQKDYLESGSDLGIAIGIRFKSLDGEYDELIEPAIGLKENLLYQYPGKIDDLGVKVKMNEQTFDNYFSQEDKLDYETYTLKPGQSFTHGNHSYILEGFDSEIESPNYKAEDNDIPIQAIISNTDKSIKKLNPIYVIRNSRPFSIKDYDPITGTHIRLSHIDPAKEEFIFQIASDDRQTEAAVIEIAENVPRSDIIVLKAQVFPGINLFWLGTCMMLLGFFVALHHRRKIKNA